MSVRLRSNKRPNYFTGQLLGEEDFQAEQKYHLGLHRDHNRSLHVWGVISGLDLERVDDTTALVRAGSATDAAGRIMVLDTAQKLPLHPASESSSVFLTIGYDEDFDGADRSSDNSQNFTRISEFSLIDDAASAPPEDGAVITLGKVQFAAGKIVSMDTSMRHLASAHLAPGSVGLNELAPASVRLATLAPELRNGWVRLPFKPSSFVEPQKAAMDFFIGVTKTYCDHRGAKGTMAIPVPMLADRLKTLVIAGERNEAQINIELDRCGWNLAQSLHEKTTLLQTQIPKKTPFYETFAINKTLDHANHALAIYVEATGDASISLIAAEFEYALGT